jgi:regulator of sigma E protease
VDACLIAVSWLNPELWLAILEVTVGLGFIIFVHELGHFAVAKFCRVKVEKFYLGFDIAGLRLGRFRWGETEYGIGILPLGGYVKMLGQEDNPAKLREEIERARQRAAASADPGANDNPLAPDATKHAGQLDIARAERALFDPRSYLAQSVPRRMAIISAGVIMNLIFAEVLAIIAFGPGVWKTAATVGHITPGGGAWQAGVQAGDEVLEVGGRTIQSFRDIFEAIALGDVENGIALVVQRPGVGRQEFQVPTERIGGRPGIGIGPASDTQLAKDEDAIPTLPGSPASDARPAFQRGDRFLKLDDQPIASGAELQSYLAQHADRPINVTVERSAAKKKAAAEAAPAELAIRVGPNPVRHLGLVMKMGQITAIQRKSPAEQAGLRPGDCLETLDGKPIVDPLRLADELRPRAGQTVTLGVSGKDRQGTEQVRATLRQAEQFCPPAVLGSPVAVAELGVAYRVLNTVRAIQPGGPAARAGLLPGDLIDKITIHPPADARIQQLQEKYGVSDLEQREQSFTLGEENLYWPCLMHALQSTLPETTVELHWSHEGQPKDAILKPVSAPDWFNPDRGWQFGGFPLFEEASFFQAAGSFREAVDYGTKETVDDTLLVFKSIRKMRSGQVSLRMLGGPWTILKAAFYEAMRGPGNLLLFLTLLSANLAVLNFLPIPLLDGGHFILLIYEGIRGKPADERVQEVLTYVGLALILALMVFVLGLDFGLIPRPGPGH